MRNKRLQKRITTGRFTLPVSVLISVLCWVLSVIVVSEPSVRSNDYPLWNFFNDSCVPAWGERFFSLLLYGIVGYLLIELNNAFAIIRMRASVQTTIFFLLAAACPQIQRLYAGDVAVVAFTVALFFLFRSYRQTTATGSLFHAFAFLGIGSLFYPQLMFFIPLCWLGASIFQSLSLKSFFASLIGWSLPYWFLLGHAFYHEEMGTFYAPFRELVRFTPVDFHYERWEMATMGYLLILFVVSSAHCILAGYEDKIRTRSFLHFLIILNLCFFVYIALQPAQSVHLLPFLLVGNSFLGGHLFVLTDSRVSNVFFSTMLVGLLLLFGFNLWTLL